MPANDRYLWVVTNLGLGSKLLLISMLLGGCLYSVDEPEPGAGGEGGTTSDASTGGSAGSSSDASLGGGAGLGGSSGTGSGGVGGSAGLDAGSDSPKAQGCAAILPTPQACVDFDDVSGSLLPFKTKTAGKGSFSLAPGGGFANSTAFKANGVSAGDAAMVRYFFSATPGAKIRLNFRVRSDEKKSSATVARIRINTVQSGPYLSVIYDPQTELLRLAEKRTASTTLGSTTAKPGMWHQVEFGIDLGAAAPKAHLVVNGTPVTLSAPNEAWDQGTIEVLAGLVWTGGAWTGYLDDVFVTAS